MNKNKNVIISYSSSNIFRLYEIRTRQTNKLGDKVNTLAISHDNKIVALSIYSNENTEIDSREIEIYDLEKFSLIRKIEVRIQ